MTDYVVIVIWSIDRAHELVIDEVKGHYFPTPYFLGELSLRY